MKALVSGLVNIETTLKIRNFPIDYYPIDYPFYGIHSDVAGVAYNLTKALIKLGDSVELFSFLGRDDEGERILKRLQKEGIDIRNIAADMDETPASVVLYDNEGRRQIHCDLKNIQEKSISCDDSNLVRQIELCDLFIACNINFNRALLSKAKKLGKLIATDVHVISDIEDSFNREFMESADILFLSDEQLPCKPEKFICKLKDKFPNQIIVIGLGNKGAMLFDRRKDKVYRLEAVKCNDVINTVGAGDALFSCFLHYYLKGYDSVDALMRAEIFASLKIGHDGAANGFSDENDIEKVLLSVKPIVHEI